VTSTQDDVTATATDSSGQTDSYHTDAHGYVDIYFKASDRQMGDLARLGDTSGAEPLSETARPSEQASDLSGG
jgi:hypothetical protein